MLNWIVGSSPLPAAWTRSPPVGCSHWLGDCAGPYWFSNWQGAVIVAGAIILPFQPTFAAILAIGVVPLIAYQYWRDVRMLHMPRLAGICRPNGPALD